MSIDQEKYLYKIDYICIIIIIINIIIIILLLKKKAARSSVSKIVSTRTQIRRKYVFLLCIT